MRLIFGCSIQRTTDDISIAISGKKENTLSHVKIPDIRKATEKTIGHIFDEAQFLPLFEYTSDLNAPSRFIIAPVYAPNIR